MPGLSSRETGVGAVLTWTPDTSGTVAKLVKRCKEDAELVEELYLTFFSRRPDAKEKEKAVVYLKGSKSRREAAEDLAWAMLNAIEFAFGH